MNGEAMQAVSFLGGPADGVVMLVPALELSVAIEQRSQRGQIGTAQQ